MFKWKEEFSSQIEKFDEQHKQLFNLGNDLVNAIQSNQHADHYDEIMASIDALKDYTEYHFNAEEALLEKHQYPKLMSHKMQHKKFLAKIESFYEKDIDENQVEITMEMVHFIADWIQNHILKVDAEYGDFLNEKGEF
ncbi:MAG: bacteriohemerythrin [Tindallia sp. MSAO_Bac2]|nr:MAG: bacteriohemerythrin [Tindallia sp. MSAO_Bac2]